MAGYWPSSWSLWAEFIDLDSVSVHKHAKTEQGQFYLAILTDKAWPIKDLLCSFQGNVSHGTQRINPSRQDSSILLTWVANHNTQFG